MLPVTHGVEFTKINILLYTLMLFAVALMPFMVQMRGVIYLLGAVGLGLGFLYHVWVLYNEESDDHAMKTLGIRSFI